MSDISKINIRGEEYDLKDVSARTQLANKADKATTLSGYGITDGATKTELTNKADKATTLAGYNINDAKITSGVITLGSNTITPYVKPSTGIAKTDLASSIQTSLGKADTAIQDVSGKANLNGATFTGNVTVGGTTINATNGHITTSTGLEIY